MFFAYDAAFTGSGATETVGERRKRKAMVREGSIGSGSSDRTYPSTIQSGISSPKMRYPTFRGLGFGSYNKLSNNDGTSTPKSGSTWTLSSRDSEVSRPSTSSSLSGRASPLQITPPEPATARVVREVAHSTPSSASSSSSATIRATACSIEIGLDGSVTQRLEKLNLRKPKAPEGPGRYRPPRGKIEWTDPHYEDTYGESSILNLFPLTSTCGPDFGYDSGHQHHMRTQASPETSPDWPLKSYDNQAFRTSSLATTHSEDMDSSKPLPKIPQTRERNASGARPSPTPKSPFQLALARMENSALKIMVKRLSEDWSECGELEGLKEALFEQKLWVLAARQWLTGGKPLQCPAHELLTASKPPNGRRILNLYGYAADGWILAAKYPSCMVITLTTISHNASVNQNYIWPPPHNHHMVYIPAADDFFPFPDNHFDVITSSTFSSVVKSQSWLPVLQECHRCLQKGGWLEIQSMDAIANRQGELLKSWVESRLLPGIEDSGLVVNPSKRVHYLEVAGFTEIKTCKIALPVVGKGGGQEQDATKVMVQTGRHYYRELYGESLRPLSLGANAGRLPWWWYNKSMRQECEREGTLFGYMISFGRKEFA